MHHKVLDRHINGQYNIVKNDEFRGFMETIVTIYKCPLTERKDFKVYVLIFKGVITQVICPHLQKGRCCSDQNEMAGPTFPECTIQCS